MTVTQVIAQSPSSMNARIRMAQANPRDSITFVIMMGRTTPPVEDPDTTMPRARARFLKNQVMVELSDALNTALEPRALTMLCARMIW